MTLQIQNAICLKSSDDGQINPAEALKNRKERENDFRVPITHEMQAILDRSMDNIGDSYLFPSPQSTGRRERAVSDQAIENVMRSREKEWEWPEPYRPHGVRAMFRSWAAEVDPSFYSVAEMALAHKIGSIVERSYDHNDYWEQRRALMEHWADYLTGGSGNVVRLVW